MLFLLAWAVAATAQPPPVVPVPTFVGAILTYSAAFHTRRVVVYGTLRLDRDVWWLEADGGERIRVIPNGRPTHGGRVAVEADVLDLGRLPQTDLRLRSPDMQSLLLRAGLTRWPRPGALLVLQAVRSSVLRPSIRPTLRAVVLECDRYAGTVVTIVGQFGGVHVSDGLPTAPRRSRHEFVLRSGDATLWVTGLRPRADNVDLDPRTRVSPDRWFAVEGTLRRDRGLVWLEGRRMAAAQAPPDIQPAPAVGHDRVAPAEVMFSIPVDGETDVPRGTTVRIQFTRSLSPGSLEGRIRARYEGDPPLPQPLFTLDYATADRVVTLRFRAPLVGFRTVVVEVLEGVTALDGSPVAPWHLTFTLASGLVDQAQAPSLLRPPTTARAHASSSCI